MLLTSGERIVVAHLFSSLEFAAVIVMCSSVKVLPLTSLLSLCLVRNGFSYRCLVCVCYAMDLRRGLEVLRVTPEVVVTAIWLRPEEPITVALSFLSSDSRAVVFRYNHALLCGYWD